MGTDIPQILLTLALLAVVGFAVRAALQRVGVPAVVSLMGLGMLINALPFQTLPPAWLEQRPFLSYAAFVLLLLRFGLMLPTTSLKTILLPAVALGTIPVIGEFFTALAFTRTFMFDDWGISALAAFIVAAVSPAVILPIMIHQIELKRSALRMVPERIIGATITNAFLAQTGILVMLELLSDRPIGEVARSQLWIVPLAVLGGAITGGVVGSIIRLERILKIWGHQPEIAAAALAAGQPYQPPKIVPRVAALIAFLVAILLYLLCKRWGFDSVVATLALGVTMRRPIRPLLAAIDSVLRQFWRVAEIVLFVNVGSYVDLHLLGNGSVVIASIGIVAIALLIRCWIARALIRRSDLTAGEQGYIVLAQTPKATIQAVFGAMPLAVFTAREQSEHIPDGHVIVVLAAVAILATAPLGAVTLERRASRMLEPYDGDPEDGYPEDGDPESELS